MDINAQQIIKFYDLKPLAGEGGLFRQTYRSAENIPGAHPPRPFGTAILYLLTNQSAGQPAAGDTSAFSAFHRLSGDEIYHFYLGSPLELTLLYPDGNSRQVILGQDIFNGQQVQWIVPRGVWQASRLLPGGNFALLGTTMAPGFTEEDYQPGRRADLLAQYPQERERILSLTR